MSDNVLKQLALILAQRRDADPSESYVAGLHHKGLNKILEKVGEEATEVILAAKDAETSGNRDDLLNETADLWFHTLVMLSHLDSGPDEVLARLASRLNTSGLAEKAARSNT